MSPNQPLAHMIDKGGLARKVFKGAQQALYDLIYNRPGGPGNAGGNIPAGGGKQGDQSKDGKGTGTGTPTTPGTGTPTTPTTPPGGGGG